MPKYTFDVPYTMFDRFVIEANSYNVAVTQLWYGIGPRARNGRLVADVVNINGDDNPVYNLDRFFKGEVVVVGEVEMTDS